MAKQGKAQKEIVGRVMHEFKHGELEGGGGQEIRNPKQAIAIALSEAGASNRQPPATNKHRLADTRRKEAMMARNTGPTRAVLYEEAARKGIAGRSRMSKVELQKALAVAK